MWGWSRMEKIRWTERVVHEVLHRVNLEGRNILPSLHTYFTLLTYPPTYLLTSWNRVLDKLTCFQLVKKFPAFYGTRKFITAFTRISYI